MNVFTRTLGQSALRRTATRTLLQARAPSVVRPSAPWALVARRGAASHVSGKPGSQTAGQAATNIKEELGNSATDFAKSISGANMTNDSVSPSSDTFLGVTSAVATSVPQPYLVVGLAGGLPYLFASGTTIYLARQAGLAASGLDATINYDSAIQVLTHAMNVQVTYGAVLLSFLGALHWGMEFAALGGMQGYRRLALGAAPVLYAWPTLSLAPTSALIAQWAGFTALWYADLKATGAGWTPKWYSQYRFYLSILVGTCIIGSLAGTSYFGPVAGHGKVTHELNEIRQERKKAQIERSGTVSGDIEAVPAGENADSYIAIKHREQPKEDSKDESKSNESEEKKDEGKDAAKDSEKSEDKEKK